MVPRTYTLEQNRQKRKQMILPTAYFAPLGWFEHYMQGDAVIEAYESFPKQTFRNRCVILSPQGERLTLSVPVRKAGSKQLTKDVEISYNTHWQHIHRQAIMSAYRRTPYYDYYEDYLIPIFEHRYKWLIDLNHATAETTVALLRNTMPTENEAGLPHITSDWQGQDIDRYWGDETSILDKLFRYGPETMTYF